MPYVIVFGFVIEIMSSKKIRIAAVGVPTNSQLMNI